ncbi:DNA PROCESSING PROTEIN SMF [Mycoplasmopsis pulmonis]|uniref:DNA PROCESSING PROTEIN SMF n=1 Tax=Mycoplasmopsis pulmonis (strain UAB CTIP) TaxID=272635 RepID=Q98Q22_MYCPU|nr:DNA-processing protein DprA [Mycoplasmopsis pulmonis]MDZ7293649.1 DNA-protecting protein DprA [Mycoplasmopsis pulmonis]CAC13720.1 DNA PROCESSING PROTEIN SMF [Mycoplasmopsis pulmonis]VEU68312.1 DNA processing protein SMF [Mycoplasmopsis pulmonis]
MNEVLLYFSFINKGNTKKIFESLKKHEQIDPVELKKYKSMLEENSIKYITILSSKYPEEFKYLNNPPFILFYKGNLDLLKNTKIALSGDVVSQKNLDLLDDFVENMKNETLVTLNFPGFDDEVVKKFIQKDLKVIFLAANGLDNPYFSQKEFDFEKNLLISIYPPEVGVKKERLQSRSEILASLAKYLVFFEFKKNSKSLHLVNFFLEMGKMIYCYPTDNFNEFGNNDLIKEGAKLITHYSDLA